MISSISFTIKEANRYIATHTVVASQVESVDITDWQWLLLNYYPTHYVFEVQQQS